MKKVLLLTFSLGILSIMGHAQKNKAWTSSIADPNSFSTDKGVGRQSFPKEFKLFNLDANTLRQDLFTIVGTNAGMQTTIYIPDADGNMEAFEITEASNFEPALQAKFPEIRAFSGRSLTKEGSTIKISYSPEGIQTMVFRTETENEFIEPYSSDHQVYAVYRSERKKGALPWSCTTEDQQLAISLSNERVVKLRAAGSSSGTLKTLRLAQSVNGEYANYFGATSSAQAGLVLAAVNATITRCNGVFEKDLAIHLNLIANTTSVFYYNPGTDPYTTLSNWNLQLQQTLTSVIGSANYDIGHMFGASGGGGNAGCIGCVCVNPTSNNSKAKGSGITSPADGIPMGDNFDIDYVAHEMGHQLGANHTFSMSLEGTGQNKEVGSGITIMGYAGITSQDVANHSIDIFHETSIAQIQANLAGKTCPVTTNISANNATPVIGAVSNYTIPISTPFALSASATDANNDPLTYCWEQNDNSTTSGSGSVASPTKTTGPNFVSFKPTTSSTRLFPKLATILAGLNVSGPLPGGDAATNTEALSSVSRTLNFRLTVRDNHPYSSSAPVAVGQTAFTDVVVTVSNTSGPFAVTAPNTNVTWSAGGSATVTWSVNNTTAAPVSCSAVQILLSTDGGNTFPIVLASSTANDGSEVVTVPNTPGTTNRIKVESIGNIFFDISNANFTIGGSVPCSVPTGLSSGAISQTSATVSWSNVGASNYDVQYKAASSGTWINAATGTTATSVNLSGLTAGTLYDWQVKSNCSASSSAFAAAQFTTSVSAPTCPNASGLSSNAITETFATVSWSDNPSAVSYDVSYKASSSSTWIVAATATTSTTLNLSGLSAGTTYDWRVRNNCASASGNYVQAQFTTNSAPATCPGVYDVSTNSATSGAATIQLNTDVYGRIAQRGENDYYKFVITTGGTVSITLSSLPADYQLALLNASGSTLQSSTNSGSSDESIDRTVTAGTYYVRIYPKNNGQSSATNCYTLNVSTGTAARTNNTDELIVNGNLMASPNPASTNVSISFYAKEAGSATVSFVNQAGTEVSSNTINVNVGNNTKKLYVGQLNNGFYYIKLNTGKTVQMSKLIIVR